MSGKEDLKKAAALRYNDDGDHAPRLLASGKGRVAEKIIEIAKAGGIPIREDSDLVESLSMLDLYQYIPPDLYRIVAEILVFIYSVEIEHASVKTDR